MLRISSPGRYRLISSKLRPLPLTRDASALAQTVPPAAVLALAIPFLGFGTEPVLLALVLYSVLPVLNNTLAGLENLDAAVLESARGMGMGPVRILTRIELPLALRNFGGNTALGVTATLSSEDPYLSVDDNFENFGDIPSGAVVWSAEDFDFTVAADAPDGHVFSCELQAQGNLELWTSLVDLEVVSAAVEDRWAIHVLEGGGFYRVQVGDFVNRDKADSVRRRAIDLGLSGAFVVDSMIREP